MATYPIDPARFREVLGQYPTGVSVVTAIDDTDTPAGMLVGSFTSVSLDPPLVAFLPAATSATWARIRTSSSFCVNVLASDQEAVCRTFASGVADKFRDVDWRAAGSGSPVLDQAVAWIDCDLEATHEAGDHHIVVGRVRELDIHRPTLPLLFFRGGYGRFAPLSLAARDESFAHQLQIIDRARPLMEAAARRLGAQVAVAHCDGTDLTVLATAGSAAPIPTAGIGQRVPVVPPIGIWWMATAEPEHVERWLRHLDDEDRRQEFRVALNAIRRRGFCVSQNAVLDHLGNLLGSRQSVGAEPTEAERRTMPTLKLDPTAFVPPERRDGPGSQATGLPFGLWAAAPRSHSLGLMIAGTAHEPNTFDNYADALLQLASEVGRLGTTDRSPSDDRAPRR